MSTLIYVQHFNKNVNVGSYESWLMSMEFQNSILLYEKLSKTVFHIIFALSFLEQPMIASYATITFCFIWGLAEKTSQRSIQPISWKCSSSRTANKAKPKFYRPSLQKKECILTWSAKKSNKLIKTKKGAIKIFTWTSTVWWSVPDLKRCQ